MAVSAQMAPALPDLQSPLPDHFHAINYTKRLIDRDDYSLDDIRNQRDELESQLDESPIDDTLDATHSSLCHQKASLSLLADSHASLASSLTELITAQQPALLLQDLERLQAKLLDLQRVRDYVAIMHHGLQLSESSLEAVRVGLPSNTLSKAMTPSVFDPYRQLNSFVSSVRNLLTPIQVEGPLSIVTFLDDLQQRTWNQLRDLLSQSLLSAAERIKWPSPTPYDSIPPPDRVSFEVSFLNLLRLQELGISTRMCTSTDPLYPIVTLIHPIAQRFHFHFETDRPTNRVDKPEWFFVHILNHIHEHAELMNGVIKYLLSKTRFATVSPSDEFTRLLLPLPRRKLRDVAFECVFATPPRLGLLANATGQALSFDKKVLESGFNVKGTTLGKARIAKSELDKWGVAWEVLGRRSELFDVWVAGEKKFDDEEYLEIISAPDAWSLTPSTDKEGELMTGSCNRLVGLLKTAVSGTFLNLLPPSHQLVFLNDVILPLIDNYHGRIKSSLDAFDTLNGILGRAIPGHMGDVKTLASGLEQTTGREGVTKLVKAWVSARHIHRFVGRWQDDLVWITLWDYICEKRTEVSSDLGYLELVPDEPDADSVFETVLNKYTRVGKRAEEMIIKHIATDVGIELKEYFTGHYANESAWDDEGEEERSAPLLPALKKLTVHLNALPQYLLTILYKPIAQQITQSFLTQSPLLTRHHRTSFESGTRLKSDITFWIHACREGVGVIRGSFRAWNMLREVGDIVGLEDQMVAHAEEIVFGDDDMWRAELKEGVGLDIEEANREVVRGLLRCRDVTSY